MPVADPSNLNGDWFGRSVGLTCEPNTNKHRNTNHQEKEQKKSRCHITMYGQYESQEKEVIKGGKGGEMRIHLVLGPKMITCEFERRQRKTPNKGVDLSKATDPHNKHSSY